MAPMLRAKSYASYPFYGPWTKVKRATPNLNRLDRAVYNWREKHLGHFVTELETTYAVTEGRIRVYVSGKPSLAWPFLVGEIIHGYRSALDNLHFLLVIAKHGDPPPSQIEEKAMFPIIYRTGWTFDRKKAGQHVNGPIVDWLERVQPDKGPKYEPLRDLALLSNYDKHRRLVLVSGGIIETNVVIDGLVDMRLIDPPTPFAGPVLNGQVISRFRVEVTGPNPDCLVRTRLSSDVVFGQDTPLPGKPVVRTLHQIRQAVVDALLEAEQFFPNWTPHPRLKRPGPSP
ncbi:MAG TPA: hypothetical protein VMO26_07425 [Vicinamibacterales bacterium]|nr:hypothetical protein [Vicinamibacterales bacterium]